MNFDTWVIGEYGTTITDPKILALMDSAWQAARRTVSGQEAVAWRDPINIEPGQSVTFRKEVADKWPHIYKQPLYTDHIPATELSDELLVELFYAVQSDITRFRIKAREILNANKEPK